MTKTVHRERVKFERPVLEEIRNGGFSPVDMHVHTNHSDAPVNVKATLKKAKKFGFGLAITDHNAISGYREAQAYESEVLLIPGIEVSASDGPHILIYFYSDADIVDFYEKSIRDNKRKSPCLAIRLGTAEIVAAAQRYHCIVAAAHPYGYLMFNKGLQKCIDRGYLPQDLIGSFQATEAVCGGMTRHENEKAIPLADRYDLGIVGGTDSHLLSDTGRVLTCSKADTADEFLDNIPGRENFIIGKELHLLEKGFAGTVVLTKYVRYTLPSLAIHYEQNIPRAKRFARKAWTHLKRD